MNYLSSAELARDLERAEVALKWLDRLPVETRMDGGLDAHVALTLLVDELRYLLEKREVLQ